MEENSYHWFLRDLSAQKSAFPCLETIFCSGDKVNDWFSCNSEGNVTTRHLRQSTQTKSILSHFLNRGHIDDYLANKYLCYVCFAQGSRLITAKEAEDMLENKRLRQPLRSLHFLPHSFINSDKVFKVQVWDEQGELTLKVRYGTFGNNEGDPVADSFILDKARQLISLISLSVNAVIETLHFTMVVASKRHVLVVNIEEINTKEESPVRRKRNLEIEVHSPESSENESPEITPFRILKRRDYTLPSIKNNSKMNSDFLEMMTKTFKKKIKKEKSEVFPRGHFTSKGALESMDGLLRYVRMNNNKLTAPISKTAVTSPSNGTQSPFNLTTSSMKKLTDRSSINHKPNKYYF